MLLKLRQLADSSLALVPRLAMMYKKQNGLTMNSENL
jgi:hypothetical protein